MSIPSKYKLEMYSADTQRFVLNWVTKAGLPIDLTNSEVLMTITKDYESEALIIKAATVDLEKAIIVFEFTPEELQTLFTDTVYSRETFWYEVRVNNLPTTETLVRGDLILHKRNSNA